MTDIFLGIIQGITEFLPISSSGHLVIFDKLLPVINLNTNDNSVIVNGKKIYANNCASCHGVNLEGQKNWMSRLPDGLMPAPPHDETGHTWHHPDRYLFMVTKYGIEEFIGEKYPNNMPAYKDILSDEEIIAVLSYIKSTWPTKIKEIHNNINSRSKR